VSGGTLGNLHMLGFDNLVEVYRDMKAAAPEHRGDFVTTFAWIAAACMVYYIVAGFIVYALGKRLIQASFAAYKESRRGERSGSA
jgi:hypothetical protein